MLLPTVLLLASGAALGGLAVLPASAETSRVITAATAFAPVEMVPTALVPAALAAVEAAPPVNVELMSALSVGLAEANKPPPPPPPPPARPAPARASRDREPAPEAGTGGTYARPGDGRLTSSFGRRWGRLHAGIDLAAGTGSTIRAAAAGTVASSSLENGYGNCVRIKHSDGTVTVYAHMSRLLVRSGERVAAGQQIGREGNTGNSTGPHLHFEVRINGTPINPLAWLRARGISV